MIKRVLISVWNKEGIIELANFLTNNNIEIISTGGTKKVLEENNIKGVFIFSGDQHYPSAHILNWKKPLKSITHSDKMTEYKIENLGAAVFDFSASPLSYKKAAGHPLLPGNQDNTDFSFEIFRPEWAHHKEKVKDEAIVIGSVYGGYLSNKTF